MRVPTPPVSDGTGRLEFAAFPVKSMTMTSGGGGIFGFRRSVGLWLARAVVPIAIQIAPASAQMFSDHPPPVPPAAVPDVPSGPALNLAPPTFKLIREERGATPNIVLPPGNYVVHVAFGLVSAVRAVNLKAETDRESFVLPAGGLRIEGRVGTSKIPQNQISFAIYKGSQFETAERASLVPNVAAGDVVLLPEGTYYIISNYGDANSVVRSDIRVQAGKLTDVIVTHRAAVITLKLVSDKGGEALANTAWSVITPGGDVIKESIGAFPRVVLSEGEYRAIAKNEGKVFERPFNVVNGVDGEVEVVAR